MKTIPWKEEYRIGHELIDAQHKNVFEIVNQLRSDLAKDEFESALMRLYKHTREHFQEEEQIMRDAHYVYYKEHRDEHNRMLKTLSKHIETVHEDPTQIARFHEFLSDWLNFHVIKEDQALCHYLEED